MFRGINHLILSLNMEAYKYNQKKKIEKSIKMAESTRAELEMIRNKYTEKNKDGL
tara:strand:+ start:102 stop:266 length:165 start_codon:yes stop_codon:yes gene_type:complete